MANISLTRVNQKLAQVRALLDGVDVNNLTSVHCNALKEAAAFHLVCAYQHYLREIAETYWLKNVSGIRTESDLSEAFLAAKKHPAEAEELISLRKNTNSWLAQLHRYYDALWVVPVSTALATVSEESQENEIIISAVNIDPRFDISQVDIPLILAWHTDFLALVKRQRETSAEF